VKKDPNKTTVVEEGGKTRGDGEVEKISRSHREEGSLPVLKF